MLSALHFREEFEDRFVYSVKSEAPRIKAPLAIKYQAASSLAALAKMSLASRNYQA